MNLTYSDFSARRIRIEDAEMMLEWRNAGPVREGMFHSREFTLEEQVPWLRSIIASPENFYYIFEFRGRPSGHFGVGGVKPDQMLGEWVMFMGPRYPELPKGAGAAMEFIALDTFFRVHGVRKLWGRTLATNERVWRMHQRFGFSIEGTLREQTVKDGKAVDQHVVGMLDREWRAFRADQFAGIFSAESRLPPFDG